MRLFTLLSSQWRWKHAFSLVAAASMLASSSSAAAAKTQEDYFVSSLPGQPEGVPLTKMFAGHVEITPEHHGNLFFWFFQNKHIADRQRLVIWLNGGPGCSSEDGALMEIGPYRVRNGGKLEAVNGSWNEFANLLFVDNPVGTGFSYVETNQFVSELQQMADQFMVFLEKWFSLFPEYRMDDIYIAGESYAGQHIPYITKTILEKNKAQARPFNLKGILIGNGWISGVDQYPAYRRYALHHGLLTDGTPEAKRIEAMEASCMKVLSDYGKDHVDVNQCERILSEILNVSGYDEGSTRMCYNMYDVRLHDTSPSCGMNWPPDLEQVTPYLRRQDVMDALHINREHRNGWQECNGAVGSAFSAQNSVPSVRLLPDILSQIPVVLFSGDKDLICNHLGTEELIHNLEWNGGKGFETSPGVWAPRRAWTFDDQPAGFYQEARNLTYVLFYNSSHMVPFDLPRQSRDMLDRFMGVDIRDIGGAPANSLIDGEAQGPPTVVGSTQNNTAIKEEGDKIKDAVSQAYRKSGEVALVIVAFAAGAWGFLLWRSRRRRAGSGGYKGLFSSDPDEDSALHLNGRIGKHRRENGDLEAAAFDENELGDLATESDDDDDDGPAIKAPNEKAGDGREPLRHAGETG